MDDAGAALPVPGGACDPEPTPPPKPFPLSDIRGSSAPLVPPKGPFTPVIEVDPTLPTHTLYRPNAFGDTQFPVVVWANGDCVKNGTMFARFLLEIASYGFVVIADGVPNGTGMGPLETNGEPQKQAIDWAVAEAARPCSRFYLKFDTAKIAAMGQSCGGLMTLGVSGDPRVTTVMIWNSGLLERDQAIYSKLHAPMAYIIGGPDDVAYPQAEADFAAINTVPLFYGSTPVGHDGTFAEDNGGEFAQVAIAWLNWQMYGDRTDTGGEMFTGAECALCKNPDWTVKRKMLE